MIDIPVYGRISVLKLFRPKSLEKDVLFVLTERYRFCVLEYVEGKKILCFTNAFQMFLMKTRSTITIKIASWAQVNFVPEPMEI